MKKPARKAAAKAAPKTVAKGRKPRARAATKVVARKATAPVVAEVVPVESQAEVIAAAPVETAQQPDPVASSAAPACHLRLYPTCTFREVADLHFLLLGADATVEPFRIDAGAVERIDTAGLQLLVSFARARSAAGGTMEWSATSEEFLRCAYRLGLSQLLSLPAGGAP